MCIDSRYRELFLSLQMKGFLFSAATHEISNLVSNIGICSDYLALTEENTVKAHLIEELSGQSSYAKTELIPLLRSINGTTTGEKRWIHLPNDLELLIKMLRAACKKFGVLLDLNVRHPIQVEADPGELFLFVAEATYICGIQMVMLENAEDRTLTLTIDGSDNPRSLVFSYSSMHTDVQDQVNDGSNSEPLLLSRGFLSRNSVGISFKSNQREARLVVFFTG